MITCLPPQSERRVRDGCLVQPGYFDLKTLALYSSCSVRWLRDRLVDRVSPLPHHRIGGKILVRKEDFDDWMRGFRTIEPAAELDALVDNVVAGLLMKTGPVRST